MRRFVTTVLIACGVWLGQLAAPEAAACPMCKAANESDQNGEPNTKPQAYMYSILFMLSMPATLLGTFGLVFWRLQRNVAQAPDDALDPPG
jgi:hypothetical protein